jgi:predicted nucleic acid-binding protein
MTRIVVSDTTAITHLAKIGALNLLQKLYGEILIPEAVSSELAQVKLIQPGALQVLNSNWIQIVEIKNKTIVNKLTKHLDLGESEAIALSIELNADILIIDEVAGRAVAKKLVHSIIGMVGVLIEAKNKGYVPAIKPYLEKLRNTGFRMSEGLYQLALRTANESENRAQN